TYASAVAISSAAGSREKAVRYKLRILSLTGCSLSPAICAARDLPPDNLPCTSCELSRCRLWARLASIERSHSQALEPSGLPNTVRKYELTPLSGICTARVPEGRPTNAVLLAATASSESS